MESLIINRVKYRLDSAPQVTFSKTANLMYRKESKSIESKLSDDSLAQYKDWCSQQSIADTDKVFFDFLQNENLDSLVIRSSEYFYPKFIKSILSKYFLERGFLVEEYPTAWDLCVYEKKSKYENNPEWEVFRKYGILIRNQSREIIINIESDQTLVSVTPQPVSFEKMHVVLGDGKIRGKSPTDTSPLRLIANRKIREDLNFLFRPKPVNYKEIYKELVSFINNHLKPFRHHLLFIQTAGLTRVSESNMSRVSLYNNKMLFGNSNVDINPITGMRDFGPYKASPKALENRFIFIYENRDDANKLYQYFKNGYRHFPGLERYVKIPATLDRDKILKYSSINSLQNEFDDFVANKLEGDQYEKHFAIVIGPFDKVEADEQESHLYYYIKNKLLRKGISSQFIDYRNIRNSSVFHFHLPNIAIAILAKMGGVPWRLENKDYQELVVGFNQVRLGSQSFIGSAVFFSNDGSLGAVNAFPKSSSTKALVEHLKQAINSYLEKNGFQIGLQRMRLVIHYFKPYSRQEAQDLESLLRDEIKIDIPYAVVEINDSKTHMDICFDEEYEMGMPESGRYVRLANNEYLLFNNNRYEKKPLRAVSEELPIKVKIHFDYDGEFSHKELINQVYEFSRLYWKSLKQKSQPVTTIYSKLIAEFSAEYEGNIPESSLASNSPWFI